MSSRYGRSREERALEIAAAIGNGECPMEHFARLHRAAGWNGPTPVEEFDD